LNEHTPLSDEKSDDPEVVWELFKDNVITAARTLPVFSTPWLSKPMQDLIDDKATALRSIPSKPSTNNKQQSKSPKPSQNPHSSKQRIILV
jgi:hypothetical protein